MTSHKDVQLATRKPDLTAELEKGVQMLLKSPHVHYLKELHAAAQSDPTYIFNNESTVCTAVQQILVKEGVQWKPDFLARNWQRVLGIAFHMIEGN
ncbi:MAG: hypothetical protein WEB37_02755 [Bacteroidota bacterium]